METHKASVKPEQDIALVSYPNQPVSRRLYNKALGLLGAIFMDQLPQLEDDDPFLYEKVSFSKKIMQRLAGMLKKQPYAKISIGPGEFKRTILAIEPPTLKKMGFSPEEDVLVEKENAEILLAQWGDGFTSPVHGHAAGYLHEEIITGKMRVNTYFQPDPSLNIVRPKATEIVADGTFLSTYNKITDGSRKHYPHNFTSIGYSATLHFVPEHTRDGRDNQFVVEHFSDNHPIDKNNVSRITGQEALYLPIGSVCLVRSSNVPEYGDHYIIITGPPVLKEHGIRPQDIVIMAPDDTLLNDKEYEGNQLVILRLNEETTQKFIKFHHINLTDYGKLNNN